MFPKPRARFGVQDADAFCRHVHVRRQRDGATGLPLKAIAAAYVENLQIASAAAKGELIPDVPRTMSAEDIAAAIASA